MRLHCLVIVAAILSIAADVSNDNASDELRKLDGTWVVESVLRDPREKGPDAGKGIRCVVKSGKVVAQLPGEDKPAGGFVIKIDANMKPNGMEIQPEGEQDAIPAIYELKGDTLRVCCAPLGQGRPTEFASKSRERPEFGRLEAEKLLTAPGR